MELIMQRKTLPSYIIYIYSINFFLKIKIITCKFEKHTAQETEEHCLILSQACNRWPGWQWSALFFFQHQVGTQKLIRQVGIWENSLSPINRLPDTHRWGQTLRSLWAATRRTCRTRWLCPFCGSGHPGPGSCRCVQGSGSLWPGPGQAGRGEQVRADTLG